MHEVRQYMVMVEATGLYLHKLIGLVDLRVIKEPKSWTDTRFSTYSSYDQLQVESLELQ